MSATIFGLSDGEYLPQPDFRTVVSANGGATATQSYVMKRDSLALLVQDGTIGKGVTATSLDPNLGQRGERFYLDRWGEENMKGGYLKVIGFFAGFAATYEGNDIRETVPTYILRGSLNETSIINHPSVQALSEENQRLIAECVDGKYVYDDSDGKFYYREADQGERFFEAWSQPSAGDAKDFCIMAAKGITTYLTPHFTWEKTWEDSEGLSTAEINFLGKVTSTPPGDPPTPNGSRDWMLTDATQTQTGQLFSNRLEFTLSERSGWNETLYDY